MCLKREENGQACHACRQRVAIESLLTIGQSRTSCTLACSPLSDNENSNQSWQSPEAETLTPPPSEAGSLSPSQLQNDDSSDLFGPNGFTSLPKKTSKLAQVTKIKDYVEKIRMQMLSEKRSNLAVVI